MGTLSRAPPPKGASPFQSLLYWIGRGDSRPGAHRRRPRLVSILVVLDWAWGRGAAFEFDAARDGFQSLLYWIGRGDAMMRIPLPRALQVSILVVLDWAWGPGRPLARIALALVSILVVLDWAWGQMRNPQNPPSANGFNPCCIGLGVGTYPD